MFLHSPSPLPSRVASARSFPSDRCHFSVYRRVRQSTLRRIISRLRSAVRFVERARRFVFLPRCRVVSTTLTLPRQARRFVFLSQRQILYPFRGVAVGDTLFHTLATANTFFAAPRCWIWVSIRSCCCLYYYFPFHQISLLLIKSHQNSAPLFRNMSDQPRRSLRRATLAASSSTPSTPPPIAGLPIT